MWEVSGEAWGNQKAKVPTEATDWENTDDGAGFVSGRPSTRLEFWVDANSCVSA
jgi:hypothetical protein